MNERRSLYCFSGGGYTPEALVKVDGIRCAATLAHPTYGLFIGGWEDDWLEQIRPQLTGPIVVYEEPDPNYPPSWPTRIVHRKPSEAAYHALDIAAELPVSPFLEEASIVGAGWGYSVLCLYGAERREDIQAMVAKPLFLTAYAYDVSEALV